MSIPKHQDVRWPLLEHIKDGDVYTLKECTKQLADFFQLTDEERNEQLSKTQRTRMYDRVYWAKKHLTVAGLVELLERGKFRITQEGKNLLKQKLSKIEDVHLEQYNGYIEFLKRSGKKAISQLHNNSNNSVAILEKVYERSNDTPYEIMEHNFKELNTVLADELLDRVKKMDYFKFEHIVLDLLEKLGYGSHKQVTKRTTDGGIDGVISDALGLNRIFVQAKRWSNTTIGRQEIQQFVGALHGFGGDTGIFITTSSFGEKALNYAKSLKNVNIVLINGQQLAQYMIEVGLGISVEKVYEVKKVNLDYFIEE
ncbi:restriction endonuclease [Priestia megaterium]|uniref:restriction endonuclease n=1 Tax=Priestia megaterium TaxID=1404 RepID=UPI0011B7E1DB|nr:restriction endonuclease [Priestia megaterium]QDZ83534.1 restriction endonuclease [Priestia megaterium]